MEWADENLISFRRVYPAQAYTTLVLLVFKKIDVFKMIQRKIPVFEKILVNIFLMGKFGQKILLDP